MRSRHDPTVRPLPVPDDATLIDRVLNGQSDHFALLVRRYQDALYRFAFGMVGDSDVAADLVQDTFVKGFTHLGRCRQPARFGIWIHQILRNRCLDYLKNRRRRNVSIDDHPQLPCERAGPDVDLDRRELRGAIRRALARLPEAQREAFLLKHVQDLSYEEMADLTGASVSALKMRVLRAREALQALLRDESTRAEHARDADLASFV
jgi:RNA polymerase sigma-70 factor (ECF subfamily)